MKNKKPVIAIVGRPNVGKSTLFNRLIGKRLAITAKEAGTTRDRIMQTWKHGGYEIELIDTGGIEEKKGENIEGNIQKQAKIAIENADLIIFVIDAINEPNSDDFLAADILRKKSKNVLLVANKADHPSQEKNIHASFRLGFGEPALISAIHNLGIDALIKKIENDLKELGFEEAQKKNISASPDTRLCIIGKPNAGKSSLINALIGDERLIVSDIPGTTRDTVNIKITFKDENFTLVDTAGIRRPGKIDRGIEKFSILRAKESVKESDIVVLLMDGQEGITHQDCAIAKLALDNKKGLILAINKIDLFEKGEEQRARLIRILQKKFAFVPWAPVVFMSAKHKKNILEILNLAKQISKEREKRIETNVLNTFLQKITQKHMPSTTKLKRPKFLYATQVEITPPRFVFFFKYPENLHFSYPRYLENQIREKFGFTGTSIQLDFKSKI